MRIISKHKDYYDHISYMYGVDDKIVYNRNDVVRESVIINSSSLPDYMHLFNPNRYVGLVIVDKIFPLIRRVNQLTLVTDINPHLDQHTMFWNRRYNLDDMAKPDERVLNMSRSVGSPVYLIEYAERLSRVNKIKLHINPIVPVLSGIIGFAKRYTADQLFQDVSYALSSQLKPSPDMSPDNHVDDKYKIQSAGFDLKQSFRHRK